MAKTLPLEHFIRIAQEYEEAIRPNNRYGVLKEIARKHGVSRKTVGAWIKEARELYLLEDVPSPNRRINPSLFDNDHDWPVDLIEADEDLIRSARNGKITAHHCQRTPPFRAELNVLEAAAHRAWGRGNPTQRSKSYRWAEAVENQDAAAQSYIERRPARYSDQDIRRIGELRHKHPTCCADVTLEVVDGTTVYVCRRHLKQFHPLWTEPKRLDKP